MRNKEKFIVILKPDGFRRKLIGKIINRFEEKGFDILDIKTETLSVKILEEHYVHLKEKVFFQDIVDYMTSGPVVIIAMEGLNGIEAARMLAGSTNSAQADPGSIRGTWALTIDENVIHVSDSVENGEHEYIRFF